MKSSLYKDRVINLYQYLQKLYQIKKNNVTNVKDYEKYFFLDEIPLYNNDDGYVVVDKNVDSEVIVSIMQPRHDDIPILPEEIEKYCISDENIINDFNKDVEFEKIDDINITNKINSWLSDRNKWCVEQKKIAEIRKLFKDVYTIYNSIFKQMEDYELLIGNGMLISNDKKVSHTILTEPLSVEFDPIKNVLKIIYSEDGNTKFDISFLDNIVDIDKNSLGEFKKEVENSSFRVLDKDDTPLFFNKVVNSFTRNGIFVENATDEIIKKYDYIICDKPVIFMRKKNSGISEAIDRIIEDIETYEVIPEHLINIVQNTNTENAENNGNRNISNREILYANEEKDIFLSKPANKEQIRIIEKIRTQNSVVVQGPPGTGKTHTIANLIGNFLAEGKSVLVTSHTAKALTVVRDKVDENLQNLCVSLIDNDKKNMEQSINAIGYMVGTKDIEEFEHNIERLNNRRNILIDEIKQLREQAIYVKNTEYTAYVYEGKSYSISEICEFLSNNKYLDKIKGDVTKLDYFPFKKDDFEFLKLTNESITVDDEIELRLGVGKLEKIATVDEMEAFADIKLELNYQNNDIKINLNDKSFVVDEKNIKIGTAEKLNSIKNIINDYVKKLETAELYEINFFYNGIKNNDISLFEKLREDCIKLQEKNKEHTIASFEYKLEYDPNKAMELYSSLNEMCDYLEKNEKINKLKLIANKNWKEIQKVFVVNGKPINSYNDCKLVLDDVTILKERKALEIKWEKLFGDSAEFESLGKIPEDNAVEYIENAIMYTQLYNKQYLPIVNYLEQLGINKEFSLYKFTQENKGEIEEYIKNTLLKIYDYVSLSLEGLEIILEFAKYYNIINSTYKQLSKQELKTSIVCTNLKEAIRTKNLELYKEYYNKINEIKSKTENYQRRENIINQISLVAKTFADSIIERSYIIEPENIELEWKYKIFSDTYEEIRKLDYNDILEIMEFKKKELININSDIIKESAWYHLMVKVKNDINKFKALEGWKQTEKKIGKGTGVKAKSLKKEARKLMAECQSIVPVWIMPISKALESLNPKQNKFDVIIIDEASQSDISSLAILYLGKKIIVVGDDEQVSPSSVGASANMEAIDTLISTYINDLPNKHLFTRDTSLYDMALQMNPSSKVVLKEHFRCVPEIIKYSNDLCYNGQIVPLRDNSSSKLKPPTIVHRVNGKREGDINIREAKEIVALIKACIEESAYENMTFGVITMISSRKQVDLINNEILSNISPVQIENRKIICGTPSEFQGDERDVIFLSFIDSNEEGGPLRKRSDIKETKQRYNVAVSRAKNQIWAVHSLDVNNDLKSGDMRKDLLYYLEHASDIENQKELIEMQSDSPFETEVCTFLATKGYQFVQQWKVGAFSIDIVALYGEKKVAIECDGEKYHSGYDKLREDMERQAILERLGWTFIRIRGSEFYSNKQKTMERVYSELENLGVHQSTNQIEYQNDVLDYDNFVKSIIREAKKINK